MGLMVLIVKCIILVLGFWILVQVKWAIALPTVRHDANRQVGTRSSPTLPGTNVFIEFSYNLDGEPCALLSEMTKPFSSLSCRLILGLIVVFALWCGPSNNKSLCPGGCRSSAPRRGIGETAPADLGWRGELLPGPGGPEHLVPYQRAASAGHVRELQHRRASLPRCQHLCRSQVSDQHRALSKPSLHSQR